MGLKKLLLPLIVPLLLVASVLLCVSHFFPWRGLFVNLATTLIGIVIVVGYVDYVIRRHDDRRWHGVKAIMDRHLQTLGNATVNSLRSAFGFSALDVYEMPQDLSSVGKATIRVAERILMPVCADRIQRLDQEGWRILVQNIQNASNSAIQLATMFGHKMPANKLQAVLDLQEKVHGLASLHSTWRDVYGVPAEQLPPNKKTNPIEWQEACVDEATEQTKQILLAAVKLLQTTQAD